jgi:peptidoglycan/xylan/chitin deacetylase (PgdA/CDA1 family)
MSDRLPTASLSLDLDNLWSYLKTHGDAGWQSRPTYLDRVVPVALELLAELRLSITFFVVGVDADRDENVPALRSIVAAGHELGNHSYEHEPWLHRYSPGALDADIARAEVALERVAGVRPRGFRGPGYSWSPALLEVLSARGYLFDASTLPTFIGPLARRYYFATAKLSAEEREERAALFGTWNQGLWPNRPHEWRLADDRRLLEIPVTVFPWIRTPFHLSYLLYLARYSEAVALGYWRAALATCRLTGTPPSVLLHPLDLIGGDVAPELRFFPGMDLGTERKRTFFLKALTVLRDQWSVVPMTEHANRLRAHGHLRERAPRGSAGLPVPGSV